MQVVCRRRVGGGGSRNGKGRLPCRRRPSYVSRGGPLLEQAQHVLRDRLGLGKHCRSGLRQDLVPRQFRGLLGVVGVLDAAARGGHVLGADLQVGDGRAEAVLDRTQVGAGFVDALKRVVQVVQLGGAAAGSHALHAEAGGGEPASCSLDVAERNVGLVFNFGVRADLDRDRGATGVVQQLSAVELGVVHHAQDFVLQLLDFLLQRLLVLGGVGTVGGLDGQFADALQVVGDFLQGAFSGLRQGDAVV